MWALPVRIIWCRRRDGKQPELGRLFGAAAKRRGRQAHSAGQAPSKTVAWFYRAPSFSNRAFEREHALLLWRRGCSVFDGDHGADYARL